MRSDLHGTAGALPSGDKLSPLDRRAEAIDALARELFSRDDPGGIWGAEDEVVRLYFRKEAVRKLGQAHTGTARAHVTRF